MHFHLPKPLHGWRAFVGEVGIIVLGVLIALGAEQLVQSAHSRQKQHETLERLFEESRVNVALLRREQAMLTDESQREGGFAAALTGGSCPPPSQWKAAVDIVKYPQVAVETSVYDEVVGAGGLAAIQSTAARAAISDFHSRLTWLQSTTDFFRSKAERAYALDDPRVTIRFDPKADEPEVASFDRDALCRDKGFRNRVAVGTRNHIAWVAFHEPVVESAIRMCAILGKLVGEQCTPSEGPPFTEAERRVASSAAEQP
jgi:hypothetical protein